MITRRSLPKRLRQQTYLRYRIPGSPCWAWKGCRTSDGAYGKLSWSGCTMRAHRLAYELLVAPIPQGMTLDHRCRLTNCINPAHMEVVSHSENVIRGNKERSR